MSEKNKTSLENFYLVLEDGTKLPPEIKEWEIEGEAPPFNPPSEYHKSLDLVIPKCFKNFDKFIENIHFNMMRNWNETNKKSIGST